MTISEIISLVTQNSWVNFFGIILAPFGVFFSIFFFLKNRKIKSVRFYSTHNTLITDFVQKINYLNIRFFNKEIHRLTVSKIAFWNNGTETIRHSDIPSKGKIFIDISGEYRILNCSIIAQTNITNNITAELSHDGKRIGINFEYMDKQDGFVLKIFHTGDNQVIFNFNGTVIGFGKVAKGKASERALYDKIIDKIIKNKSKQRLVKIILHITVFSLFLYGHNAAITNNLTPLSTFALFFVSLYSSTLITRRIKIPTELVKYINEG